MRRLRIPTMPNCVYVCTCTFLEREPTALFQFSKESRSEKRLQNCTPNLSPKLEFMGGLGHPFFFFFKQARLGNGLCTPRISLDRPKEALECYPPRELLALCQTSGPLPPFHKGSHDLHHSLRCFDRNMEARSEVGGGNQGIMQDGISFRDRAVLP